MRVVVDDLTGADVTAFLAEHLAQMHTITPPESVHALAIDELRRPEVTFFTVRDGPALVACGALKALDAQHGEVKSMRTDPARRRSGVASLLLSHMIDAAERAGFTRLSLETGADAFFAPARRLYTRHGFTPCGPFADYADDPLSVYLTRSLPARPAPP